MAGPLYSISRVCERIRDNKLTPSMRQLRKGDELQEFYGSFREMYEALRARAGNDVTVLAAAIAQLEAQNPKTPQVTAVLTELRELRQQKERSLEDAPRT